MALFEPIFAALNAAGARYVVVGGLAVVLHGYARLTADVDLIIDLAPDRATEVIGALGGIELRPSAVQARDFASAEVREQWIKEKGMVVLSMIDPTDPVRVVDLFVDTPIPFEDLHARAVVVTLAEEEVRIASIDDLILLKRSAGRPQDIEDIAALEALRDE